MPHEIATHSKINTGFQHPVFKGMTERIDNVICAREQVTVTESLHQISRYEFAAITVVREPFWRVSHRIQRNTDKRNFPL